MWQLPGSEKQQFVLMLPFYTQEQAGFNGLDSRNVRPG